MSPIPVNNMDQVEAWEGGGGILPPGKHVVTVTDEDDSTTSSGGNPQIVLNFSADDGMGIRDWVVVKPPNPDGSGGTYGKVRQLFEAAGLQVPTGPNAMLSSAPLRGKKLLVTVADQPDNKGGMRSRVVAYEPIGAGEPTTPSAQYATAGAGQSSDLPF